MATLIQVRRDTLANWNSNNPVLSSGEIAFVTDENKFKVGNGSSTFNALPYLQADAYVDSVILGIDTTGNYVAQTTASGPGISVTGSGESASVVIENTGVTSLSGTANEVEVSASTGSVTISLPSTINANTTGTAASLTTPRTIALSGDVSGSVTFDGSASVDIATQIQPDSVALGTDTTGNYVTQVTGSGAGISVSGSGESASVVVSNTGVTSILGTEDEINVSASTGYTVLSLPTTINANTTGTAAALTNARTIALGGDLSGSASFDGSASISISADIQPNSVVLGTDTTGNYVATASAGSGISISGSGSEDAAITISNTGVTSLTGTVNQITVSASNGDSTISLPAAVTFPGTVTLNGNPNGPLEAVTKQYVDAIAEGLHIHASVATATTASIDLSSPSASVDGVALTNNMRVLVKNQSDTTQNGIYVYNSASAILVRASDFDTSAEIQGGDFVFVTGGNTYEDTGWVQTETVTTVGTDPILFTQFAGAGTYTAGTGLLLDGTVFSNTGVLSLTGTANEITVSASSGNITVSLPDDVALTGIPTSTTASVDTNTTQIATTAYVVGQGYLKASSASTLYQPLDGDLTSIAGLSGTSGLLRKTGADTYTLDTTTISPTGGGSDKVFFENGTTITSDYTIGSNKNSGSFGPITIDTGVTVTVPSGSSWQVL